MQLSRDDLIIELATLLPKEKIQAALELQRALHALDKEMHIAKQQYQQQVETIKEQRWAIQQQCEHPHTYHDWGGQYEPQRTYCSVCGQEL